MYIIVTISVNNMLRYHTVIRPQKMISIIGTAYDKIVYIIN